MALVVGVRVFSACGWGHGVGKVVEVGWGQPVVGFSESAGPGEVSGLGVGEGPAALVAQPVIVAARRADIDVGRFTAVGVFDAVVGVRAVRGHAAAGVGAASIS